MSLALLLYRGGGGGTTNTQVTAGVGNIVLTGYAPTIAQTANQSVLPNVGSLVITGYAPTVTQGAGQAVNPSTGSLVITGYAPSISQSTSQAINPSVGSLVITGYAPNVVQSGVSTGFNGGFDMSRPRKVYIKRGKQYLIFNNNEEADVYLAAEKAIETAKKSSRGAAKRVIKALKVVKPEIAPEPKLEELSALIAKFDFKYDLPQLAKNNDIEALYHIQSMLYALQQDEEDIELLLLAL